MQSPRPLAQNLFLQKKFTSRKLIRKKPEFVRKKQKKSRICIKKLLKKKLKFVEEIIKNANLVEKIEEKTKICGGNYKKTQIW